MEDSRELPVFGFTLLFVCSNNALCHLGDASSPTLPIVQNLMNFQRENDFHFCLWSNLFIAMLAKRNLELFIGNLHITK